MSDSVTSSSRLISNVGFSKGLRGTMQTRKEREERKRRKKMGPILFLSLLIHLSISTQAEHDESYNDKEASNNGTRRQGLIF